MPLEFIRLTAKQILELPAAQTVFFFPVGPLEDHGPHLPIGLDVTEAEALCRMTAERLEQTRPGWVGVIMPAAPLGVSSNTSGLALTVRGYVLRDWLVDACRGLMRAKGFRQFVCVSGQLGPRQLTAIEDAGRMLTWKGPFSWFASVFAPRESPLRVQPVFVSASSALVSPSETAGAPLWSDPLEHGARRDTSVALRLGWMDGQALTPATVEALGLVAHPRGGTPLRRAWALFRGKRSGWWGPGLPGDASAEAGEAAMRSSVDHFFPKLHAVWDGSNPNLLFRSWYSILPPNKSTFVAWLLSFSVIVIMLAWLVISIRGMVPGG